MKADGGVAVALLGGGAFCPIWPGQVADAAGWQAVVAVGRNPPLRDAGFSPLPSGDAPR